MSSILGIRSAAGVCGMADMTAALDHAPSGEQWAGDGVGLGFRQTPGAFGVGLHFDREAGLALAAHVRLDDPEGLAAALGLSCAERASLTDGDLVLHSYRRWGTDAPSHLMGDYAFALWDARRRTLFCARDHIGVQPFYYALTAKGFVFAGAMEAVLAAPGVSGELDEAIVVTYLTRVYLRETSRTLFKEVRKLPPGHSLTVLGEPADTPPVVRLQRHWHPQNAPPVRRAGTADYAAEFLALYEQAVKARLRTPGPVGAHLSGGLDSSSIAVLAARELRRQGRPPPLAFSWLPNIEAAQPNEGLAPEYALINAVCAQEGLQVRHCSLSVDDIVALLRRDGALPGVHVHPNEEAVQRCAAEQGVRVLLSGWGGDEGVSFNGRGHHAQLLLRGRWRRLAAAARSRGRNPLGFAAAVALPLLSPRLLNDLRRRFRYGEPWRRRWLANPALLRRHKIKPRSFRRLVGMRRTQLVRLQDGALSERIEGWAASGARRGIEYRYPLLDHRLVEFALGLPPEQFLCGKWSRYLMRHALQGVLPAQVCWNPSKDDPARVKALMDAFTYALPVVRRQLQAHDAPLSRAHYLDMPLLLERTDAAWFRAKPLLSPILRALQFLDF